MNQVYRNQSPGATTDSFLLLSKACNLFSLCHETESQGCAFFSGHGTLGYGGSHAAEYCLPTRLDHRTPAWRSAHGWHVASYVLVIQASWRKKALIRSTCQFHGVNTPTTAIFKLPTVYAAHRIPENLAVRSNEPTQISSSTLLLIGPPRVDRERRNTSSSLNDGFRGKACPLRLFPGFLCV